MGGVRVTSLAKIVTVVNGKVKKSEETQMTKVKNNLHSNTKEVTNKKGRVN